MARGASVVLPELPEATQLYPKLIGLALVVTELLRSEVVDLVRRLGLDALDAIQSSDQACHVVLEEFHKLRIQWLYLLLRFLTERTVCTLLSDQARMLLLLEPHELVSQKRILQKHLLLA